MVPGECYLTVLSSLSGIPSYHTWAEYDILDFDCRLPMGPKNDEVPAAGKWWGSICLMRTEHSKKEETVLNWRQNARVLMLALNTI